MHPKSALNNGFSQFWVLKFPWIFVGSSLELSTEEFFLDLSLDISELDTGLLGLRGSAMQPLLELLEEEEEDEDEVQGWLF